MKSTGSCCTITRGEEQNREEGEIGGKVGRREKKKSKLLERREKLAQKVESREKLAQKVGRKGDLPPCSTPVYY